MSWEKVKLGDICAWVASGGTPLTSKADYYSPKEIPWLKTQEVTTVVFMKQIIKSQKRDLRILVLN